MTLPSLADLHRRYVAEERPLPRRIAEALACDGRAGARRILSLVERRRAQHRAEGQRLRRMLRFERACWGRGVELVAGVDEAGMSPLAGPVAAAAVILPVGCRLAGVDDSKKLSPQARQALAPRIREVAVAWAVAFAEPEEIDRVNIYWAGVAALERAVRGLRPPPEHVLVDARPLRDLVVPQEPIVRGDQRSLTIAAASILAKTARDERMCALDRQYPGYGFARHKGYPVPEHYAALRRLGACPMHRSSFAPVRAVLGEERRHG